MAFSMLKSPLMSFYEPKQSLSEPDFELDLHGCTTIEAKQLLDEFVEAREHDHVRIIVGKGMNSEHGAVLPSFVHNHLARHGVRSIPYFEKGYIDCFFS